VVTEYIDSCVWDKTVVDIDFAKFFARTNSIFSLITVVFLNSISTPPPFGKPVDTSVLTFSSSTASLGTWVYFAFFYPDNSLYSSSDFSSASFT
jgi:hypothetical protein